MPSLVESMRAAGIQPDTGQAAAPAPTAPLTNSQSASPLVSQMQSAGINPSSVTEQAKPTPKTDSITAFAAGINNTVEQTTTGIEHLVAKGIDNATNSGILGKYIGTNYAGSIKSYEDSKIAEYNKIEDEHPLAFNLGGLAANIGEGIVTGPLGSAKNAASLIKSGATFGGIMSGLNYTGEEGIKQNLINSAEGIAGGAVAGSVMAGVGNTLKLLGKVANRMYLGYKIGQMNADEVTNAAINNLTQSKVNPTFNSDDLFKSMHDFEHAVITQDNQNYSVVKDLSKFNVSKTNLQTVFNEMLESQKLGSTSSLDKGLSELKSTLGLNPNKEVPANKAIDLSRNLGNLSYAARVNGDKDLADVLYAGKQALDKDIETAGSSVPGFNEANAIAKSYHATTVGPLQDTFLIPKIFDKASNESYINTIINSLKKSQEFQDVYKTVLPEQMQQQIEVAHLNALREASSPGGKLDLNRFTNAWANEAAKNGSLFNNHSENTLAITGALKDLSESLKNQNQAAGHVGRWDWRAILTGGLTTGGILTGFLGHPVAGTLALLTAGLNRGSYLYSAGKVMNNPNMAKLLPAYADLINKDIQSPIRDSLGKKIGTYFMINYANAEKAQYDQQQKVNKKAN